MPKSIQTPQPITETLEYLQGIFEYIEQEQPTAEQIQKLIKVAKAPLQYVVSVSTQQTPQASNQPTHNEHITDVEQASNERLKELINHADELRDDVLQLIQQLQDYIAFDDVDLIELSECNALIAEVEAKKAEFEQDNANDYLLIDDECSKLNAYALLDEVYSNTYDLMEAMQAVEDYEELLLDEQAEEQTTDNPSELLGKTRVKNAVTINTDHLQPPVNPNRTVIDVSKPDDKEVVVMSSYAVCRVAEDLHNASQTFSELATVLGLIASGEINYSQMQEISNLAQYNAETWCDLLDNTRQYLNKGLAHTALGIVGEGE